MPSTKHADTASGGTIRNLDSRRERDRTGLFFVEGLRFVAQALTYQAPIQTVITVPKLLTHPFAQKLLRQLAQRHIPVLEVTPEVFLRHSRAEEAQWIGAVVAQRWDVLDRIDPCAGLCWLALDTIHSQGNLGTILRTCDAVGAAGAILLGPSVDPHDPACVRATMGAVFTQRLVRTTEREFDIWRRRHGCTLVGTSPHATTDYQAASYPRPLIVWMGGEKRGLSPLQQNSCDLMVRLPMVGASDSLNVAIASGVMLYEVFNQQRR
jgi:TrmH family RNA methyltransferase